MRVVPRGTLVREGRAGRRGVSGTAVPRRSGSGIWVWLVKEPAAVPAVPS